MNCIVRGKGLKAACLSAATILGVAAPLPLLAQTAGAMMSVPYISGGVGNASQSEIERLSSQYRLKVVNSLPSGEFVADVRTQLLDQNGRVVLDTVVQDPILLANPAPGTYTLVSNFQGQNQTKKITIGSSGQTHVANRWIEH